MFRRLLILGLVFIATGARGGVTGSHHDLAVSETGAGWSCYYCHATFDSLLESAYREEEPEDGTGLGPVGVLCYACHDGTAFPDARIEALDGTVGLPALLKGHGFSAGKLGEVTDGLEGPSNLAVSGLLPAKVSYPGRMDCTACHDPHNPDNQPFLRVPLEALCPSCHSGSDGAGLGRWTTVEDAGEKNGAHPTGMSVAESGLDPAAWGKAFHGPESFFEVPKPDKTSLMSPDVHWEMGGHLFGPRRTVSCPTCHSAHLPTEHLLVSEVSADAVRMRCMGCHGREVFSDTPGRTPYHHPVFEESGEPYGHDHAAHGDVGDPTIPSAGFFGIPVAIPSSWPIGTEGELACRTCHAPHHGRRGTKCLRESPSGNSGICNDCHEAGSRDPAGAGHHPTTPDPVSAFGSSAPSWRTGKGSPGDLGDGLQCIDCHVGLSGGAHNW